MSTGSRYSSTKRAALKHWRNNLACIESMDWDEWVKLCYKEEALASTATVGYPKIYATHCSYCNESRDVLGKVHCGACPLWEYRDWPDDGEDHPSCCEVWNRVRLALLHPDKDKKEAIQATKEMIEYIKEVG